MKNEYQSRQKMEIRNPYHLNYISKRNLKNLRHNPPMNVIDHHENSEIDRNHEYRQLGTVPDWRKQRFQMDETVDNVI
ncbi:unnamed protein product [Heterobilharzia americana]|nr:unnamed protein product [Heterobilharzia americana]